MAEVTEGSVKLIVSNLQSGIFQIALQHCKKAYCWFEEWITDRA